MLKANLNLLPTLKVLLETRNISRAAEPLHLSQPFLRRITRVPVSTVMLEGAGHYPLEQPGLTQMVEAIDAFYRQAAPPDEKCEAHR